MARPLESIHCLADKLNVYKKKSKYLLLTTIGAGDKSNIWCKALGAITNFYFYLFILGLMSRKKYRSVFIFNYRQSREIILWDKKSNITYQLIKYECVLISHFDLIKSSALLKQLKTWGPRLLIRLESQWFTSIVSLGHQVLAWNPDDTPYWLSFTCGYH